MDNASNNNTFMVALERILRRRNIKFNRTEQQIRYAELQIYFGASIFSAYDCRCFPHIVNLACKAVLAAITNLDFAADTSAEYVPHGPSSRSFSDALRRDPIATVRSLIRSVSIYISVATGDFICCIHRSGPHHFAVKHFRQLLLICWTRIYNCCGMLTPDGLQHYL